MRRNGQKATNGFHAKDKQFSHFQHEKPSAGKSKPSNFSNIF